MTDRILIPKSKLVGTEIDTVKNVREKAGDRLCLDLLFECQRYWDNLEPFRRERERNKRYTYGDQWGDMVKVGDKSMTEAEYIKQQGSVPLKNNLIRRLVRNVLGVYRSQSKEPTCTARDRDEQKTGEVMSATLQYNMMLNKMEELNARTLEELMIGSVIAQKVTYGWRNDKMDVWTDYINPNNLFFDTAMQDIRHWDLSVIGEVHDITFTDLCTFFAKNESDYKRLSDMYHTARNRDFLQGYLNGLGSRNELRNMSFLLPYDTNLCRVIEVWSKEAKKRYRCHDYLNGTIYKIELKDKYSMVDVENNQRLEEARQMGMPENEVPLIECEWFIDSYWYYRFLSPTGDILIEGETPYEHKSHPYILKVYPFIDGEAHSFVGDVIDQQRYINRLITMNDWIMRASAKGVMLFPEELLPDNMTIDDIADEWSKFNGIIMYKAKPGVDMPKQIANNSTNIGINEMLAMQLKLMEDISGVNGALQGKTGYAGTAASLYAQQAQNATTSLLDLLDSFSGFIKDTSIKTIKTMQQFYDNKKVVNIAGKAGKDIIYDPEKIRNVEFDISVSESASTPVNRMLGNELLMQLFSAQAISVEQLLENGNFPFADNLLQSIKSQKEQLSNGQVPDGLPDDLMQQVQQQINPKAMGMLNQAIS